MQHETYQRGVEACIWKGKAFDCSELEMRDVACGLCGLHRLANHVRCRVDTPCFTCGTHDIRKRVRQDAIPASDVEHTVT